MTNEQTKPKPPLQLNKGIHKRPCWCILDGGYVWCALTNTTMKNESLDYGYANMNDDEVCT